MILFQLLNVPPTYNKIINTAIQTTVTPMHAIGVNVNAKFPRCLLIGCEA